MAAFAILAKTTAMDIVTPMAAYALLRQFGGVTRSGVAGRADQSLMLTGQRKFGRDVMIEIPHLPVG